MKPDIRQLDNTKVYLVTGAAGFIGFHLSRRLLSEGCTVIGLDNLNDYYDVQLKRDRLAILKQDSNFTFVFANLEDKEAIDNVFKDHKISIVNLPLKLVR